MATRFYINNSGTNYNKYNLKARCKYYLGASTNPKDLKSVSNWIQIRVNL